LVAFNLDNLVAVVVAVVAALACLDRGILEEWCVCVGVCVCVCWEIV